MGGVERKADRGCERSGAEPALAEKGDAIRDGVMRGAETRLRPNNTPWEQAVGSRAAVYRLFTLAHSVDFRPRMGSSTVPLPDTRLDRRRARALATVQISLIAQACPVHRYYAGLEGNKVNKKELT